MDEARWERLAPLSGIAFVVLFIVGAVVINNYDYLPPAGEIQAFYTDGSTRIGIGAYIGMIAAFFLLWFAGSLRSRLRIREGSTGRLSAVAFGGGVAAGAGIVVAYAIMLAASQRAGTDGGIGIETATGLFDVSGALLGAGVPIALAAMIGATAVVSLRTGFFAGWLTWSSIVFAVGLLTPFGYIFLGLAALWIVIVSTIMARSAAATFGSV